MVPLLLVCKTIVEWIFWPWFDFKKALAIWTNHKSIFAKNNRSSRKNRDNIALRFRYSCCCCFFSIYKDMFSHILLIFSCLSGWYAKQFIYETVDLIKEFIVKQGKKETFERLQNPKKLPKNRHVYRIQENKLNHAKCPRYSILALTVDLQVFVSQEK